MLRPSLLLMGWLLPWFVGPFSAGAGPSPQDAVVSAPTGVGTVLIYVLAITMLDARALAARRARQPLRQAAAAGRVADRIRLVAALTGLVATIVVWFLIAVVQEEPLFGSISKSHGDRLRGLADHLRLWPCRARVRRTPVGADPPQPRLRYRRAAVRCPAAADVPPGPDFLLWAASSLAIYMLLALGLNVVVGFAGLLDLGYAAFFAIGAYACASLASPAHHIHLPLWVLIFVGAAVASLFGAVLGAPTLRLRGDYLAIVTLGFGEIVPDLATNNVFNLTGGPNGISGIDQPKVLGINFASSPQWYYWALLLLSVVVVILLAQHLHDARGTRVGRLARGRGGRGCHRHQHHVHQAAGVCHRRVRQRARGSVLRFAGDHRVPGRLQLLHLDRRPQHHRAGRNRQHRRRHPRQLRPDVRHLLGAAAHERVVDHRQPDIQVPALAGIDFSSYTYIVYGAALILMMLFRPGGLLPSRARRIELQTGAESESLAAVQGRA